MARVTVEDCVLLVPNRFELVMLAAQRARAVASGAPLTLDRDNDKNPVVALREIADQTVDLDNLRVALVGGLQRNKDVDEPEEDNMAALMTSSEWAGVAQEPAESSELPAAEGEAADAAAVEPAPDAEEE